MDQSSGSGMQGRGRIGSTPYAAAHALALRWHAGQTDKGGAPYLRHLEQVAANLLARWPDATAAQVQAALLHDVLEDTDCPPEEVEAIGPDVLAIVRALTKPAGAVYLDYVRALSASGNVSAMRVKLADLQSNCDPARAWPGQAELIDRKYAPARAILEAALR